MRSPNETISEVTRHIQKLGVGNEYFVSRTPWHGRNPAVVRTGSGAGENVFLEPKSSDTTGPWLVRQVRNSGVTAVEYPNADFAAADFCSRAELEQELRHRNTVNTTGNLYVSEDLAPAAELRSEVIADLPFDGFKDEGVSVSVADLTPASTLGADHS